eukprot:15454033-Alexandrium_andersonii.AAC.1
MSNTMSNVVHEQNQRQATADSKLDMLGNMMQQTMASQSQLQSMMTGQNNMHAVPPTSVAASASTQE